MLQVFRAVNNSTIWDVCLSTYGSFNFLAKLMDDNNFTDVNVLPKAGQEFVWEDTLVKSSTSKRVALVLDSFATAERIETFENSIISEGDELLITEDNQIIINE